MAPGSDPLLDLAAQLKVALTSTYEVERELGGGGMSRVFLATDRALGRRVVVKVLPPELTAGVNRDRFRREIQIAARLQHPHIVPLLTAGQEGDLLYYTMPFIEGETLRGRIERESRLPPGVVVAILVDLVDALAHAHDHGLVHRDIKPENILLHGTHALLTDFGVAKAISAALPAALGSTTVGLAVGTPAYMAPEQLAADPAADHRMDLYAVGLIAYELLSGASPFSGKSPQATLASQLTERPTPPHITRRDVPHSLSGIVMRCLEKDPGARPASAREVLAALRAVPGPGRVRRWRPVAAAALLVVAAAAGALWIGKDRTPALPNALSLGAAAAIPGDSVPALSLTDTGDAALRAGPVSVPVLTRADSEAIAAAVGRRLQRSTPATPAALSQQAFDSLVEALERQVVDSVLRTLARTQAGLTQPSPPTLLPGPSPSVAPTRGQTYVPDSPRVRSGPRRVVVAPVADGTRGRQLGDLAGSLTDSLAARFRRDRRFALVPMEETRTALQKSRNALFLAGELDADLIVSAAVYLRGVGGADSVHLVAAVTDPRNPFGVNRVRDQLPSLEAPARLAGFARQVYALALQSGVRVEGAGPRFVRLDSAGRDSLRRLRDSLQPPIRRDSAP